MNTNIDINHPAVKSLMGVGFSEESALAAAARFIIRDQVDMMIQDEMQENGFDDEQEEHDPFLHDGEADADALASCGLGMDEDYGCYGGGEE